MLITGVEIRSARVIHEISSEVVKEYIEREELFTDLAEALQKPGGIVVMVGLGGTGKTQLATRYAQRHQGRYDYILWIDARSEGAIRSSFHRCARALNVLPKFDRSNGELRQDPAVQNVLQWLYRQDDRYGETLVIFDNADDFSTGVMTVVPTKIYGSIIITTRNTHSLQLLPERSRQVDVGDMTAFEAESLLMRHLGLNATELPENIRNLSRQICGAMHWSALAVHLAGAQLRMNFAGRSSADCSKTTALLEKFLSDVQSHKSDILKAETVNGMFTYNLTIFTVLDSSLKIIDATFPHLPSRLLLLFLTHMEATNIPDSLFYYVARALADGQDDVARKLPSWLMDFLLINEHGKWDDFKFREALKPLWQYGIVKSSRINSFTQISIHDLIRWKVRVDGEESQKIEPSWDAIHAMFQASAIRQVWIEKDPDQTSVEILTFIRRFAPAAKAFLSAPIDRTDSVLDMIGEQYELGDRIDDTKRLYEALAVDFETIAPYPGFISDDFDIATARKVNLRTFKSVTHLWSFPNDPLERAKDLLGFVDLKTSPVSYNALAMAGNHFVKPGYYDKAEEICLVMMDKALRIWGSRETRYGMAVLNLAELYMAQGKSGDAEVLLKQRLKKDQLKMLMLPEGKNYNTYQLFLS